MKIQIPKHGPNEADTCPFFDGGQEECNIVSILSNREQTLDCSQGFNYPPPNTCPLLTENIEIEFIDAIEIEYEESEKKHKWWKLWG